MTHRLTHPETGKTFTISIEGKTITTQTGKTPKEVAYESQAKAELEFQKKSWEMLKKGFIFRTDELQKCEAYFHQFLGKGYTGCLSLVDLDGSVGVYKHNDFKNDWIQLFTPTGDFLKTLELHKALPWSLAFSREFNVLLIAADHHILQADLSTTAINPLTKGCEQPGSFVSVGKEHAFYGSAPFIYLKNLASNEVIFSKKTEPELYSGHSTQFKGCIDANGNVLTLCTKAGEIEMLDHSGQQIKTIQGDFQMVEDLAFLNENILLVQEKYGTWGLRLFDMQTGAELPNPFKRHPFEGTLVDYFDLNQERTKILAVCRDTATVYDASTFDPILEFQIAHCVKKANAVFVGNTVVATRTDYGCFSLYHV